VAAAGLRARGTFSHTPDQAAAGPSGAALAIALSAAEGVAFIAFLVVLASIRYRPKPKRDDDEEPWRPNIPWWVKTLGVLLAVAALVTPFAVLFTRKSRPLATAPLTGSPAVAPGHVSPAPPPGPVWPLIAGMVLAIAVVLALTLLARRKRPAWTRHTAASRLARLLDSLAAGSAALTAGGEPRAAIIACYTAMERGFAAAGPAAAPAPADTPAEVLARASRAGIVSVGPAETLTGLFRLARYSTHPMTSADSEAAAHALAEMRADLAASAP